MMRNRKRVQSRYQPEPEIQNVKRDKEKQNDAGHSLNRIEPISRIRVMQIVRTRLDRNHQSINGVID